MSMSYRQQHKLCILFLYHKCDDVTRYHLECLLLSNPDAVVVPLTDSISEHLPNTIDVGEYDDGWCSSDPWRNIDVTVYKWFNHRTFDAEKYLFIEYDCFCNVNLIDYYKEVWDSDVAGVDFFTIKENPKWPWFEEESLLKLPPAERPYASGLAPFVCCLFSHSALERIIAHVSKESIFCELRLGTAVRMLDLKFKKIPLSKRSTICWHPYPWKINRSGLYHGIKSCNHNEGKMAQPNHFLSFLYDIKRSYDPRRHLLAFGQTPENMDLFAIYADR
uniref:Uncharacterized protein n=1 Tax=Candidatus Kentrum sp. LPFa TaxID=2126335 RepID=A0A450VTR5_9GAMM|nr:MAG: hypothetical protein BECKLPF1236A_GA0070988_100145 [Candidatus Kentron sp. LPFa]VFK24779.1 MAG: hypothetical protein BECKLPF1236C_GA0070990_100165 [Candidatus Kentron sp. LPFa]